MNPAHLARNTDPDSSHEAAERAAHSKWRESQCEYILGIVTRYPGQTSRELATQPRVILRGLDRYDLARRLADLENADKVVKVKPTPETKPCKVSGKRVCRWWPKVEQGRLFT